MTNYVSSISIDTVIDALKDFITPFMQGGQVVRAQVNRVAMPLVPCAVLTELLEVDLSVPYEDYQPDDSTTTLHGRTRIDVQIDLYGAQAGELCQSIKTAFRTLWAYDKFPDSVKPLYTSDGVQSPLITGEQQYESRWTITVSMQYNPQATVPQQFADTLTVSTLQAVDLL